MNVRECDRANEEKKFFILLYASDSVAKIFFIHSEATEHVYRYIKQE